MTWPVVVGLLLVVGTAHAATRRVADGLGAVHEAFRAGDYERAEKLATSLISAPALENKDYALYFAAESAFFAGDFATARKLYERLGQDKKSRFAAGAPWRAADCQWELGDKEGARAAYTRLLGKPGGEPAVARFRIAEALAATGKADAAQAQYRAIVLDAPAHPLAEQALARLSTPLTPRERIARAANLTRDRDWTHALAELAWVGDDQPDDVRRLRDFHLGNTLFKMRRQYTRAGRLLLSVHEKMGALAAYALFHGARGLSRGDRDDEAIGWYKLVVENYPRSEWAAEAQFLSGWLEYNRGNFKDCIPGLEGLLDRYGRSKFADDALWYLGYAHFLLGEHDKALPLLDRLARQDGELIGGKGRYWRARTLDALGRPDEATRELRALVTAYPLSWYALLARARLKERGVDIGPWGDGDGKREAAPLAGVDPRLASEPLIRRVDELIAAGLTVEAGFELRRGEKDFIKKHKPARALPVLFDRYWKAENFNRPWALSEGYGRSALRGKPEGAARAWWQAHYPLAAKARVDKYKDVGQSPPYWLYAIMYKESGFDPHVVSYADAIGLLQMIPPTTERVAKAMGLVYTDDLLFDPEKNIMVGSWYIGRLWQKFKGQAPLAAGAYNGGPRAMMRWLSRYGDRPIDEFVELCSYTQSREYMKKVTSIYARYLMLYDGKVYEQPLGLDPAYLENDVNY